MDIRLVAYFVLLLILLFLLAIFVYYYFLLRRKVIISKRFDRFCVKKNGDNKKIFDSFFNYIDNFITKISKLLYKNKLLSNYSLKYQKYINKENRDYLDKMDFVTRKIMIGLLFIILVIIYNIIRFEIITVYQIVLSFIIGFYLLDLLLISQNKLLKKERENDLLKAITIMNNSFKSGKSIMQAIEIVAIELDSPLGLEFKKMYVDLTYGLSLEVTFKRFEERVKLDEAKYITASLTILNNTGGNIIKVFESVEKTFFNTKKMHDELKNLTAASKFLYYVLLLVPIIFVLVITVLDKDYFVPLYTSSLGIIIIILCLSIYIIYFILIKKLLKLGDNYVQ